MRLCIRVVLLSGSFADGDDTPPSVTGERGETRHPLETAKPRCWSTGARS